MIRLSVSDLETYRYWKADEGSTVEQLVERLAHRAPPTPQMMAGRALAKLFELARDGDEVLVTEVDGWRFTFALDQAFALPPVRELKAEVVYQTPNGPVTLVGKVDGLAGLTVHDQKLTERWDPERYLDSLQWRAYLDMFGADTFVYDVFVAYYSGANDVKITEYNRMPFYRYPGLADDVRRAVVELAEVVAEFVPEARP